MRVPLIGLMTVLMLIAIGITVMWFATEPEELPPGTESASRLAPGPYAIGQKNFDWIDSEGRRIALNGEIKVTGQRPLPATMWYPKELEGKLPLLVFSHGLMSSRFGCTHMAEHLASYGYVVASADHPFSHADVEGGPNHMDVVNQPGDLSFLIDQVLKLDDRQKPFNGSIDAVRIGAFGISLGADTVTLAGFHPVWRDPHIAAVVSIVGHGDVFGSAYFEHAPVPFLMIAGTADAIVDYEVNATPIPGRIRYGGLLTINRATHAGFTHVTAGLLRILGNPDNLGCGGASPEDIPRDKNPFVGVFGTEEQGLLTPVDYQAPCSKAFEDVMRAGRQQSIATLAVRAFFDSHFAETDAKRAVSHEFLASGISTDLEEVIYQPAVRVKPDD